MVLLGRAVLNYDGAGSITRHGGDGSGGCNASVGGDDVNFGDGILDDKN